MFSMTSLREEPESCTICGEPIESAADASAPDARAHSVCKEAVEIGLLQAAAEDGGCPVE